MTIDDWLNIPHILIGSRAFDVAKDQSDYDIVVMKNNLPNEMAQRLTMSDHSIERYFNLLPPNGEGWILRGDSMSSDNPDVDVIVLNSAEDITIIQVVLAELRQLPNYYLKSKQMRVDLFESGLKHYGWTKPIEPDYGIAY